MKVSQEQVIEAEEVDACTGETGWQLGLLTVVYRWGESVTDYGIDFEMDSFHSLDWSAMSRILRALFEIFI